VVKTLSSDEEWDQALQAQLVCHWPGDDTDHSGFPAFMAREMERYRAMTQAGLGHWFGAYLGEQFTATLGLFVDGEIGRFQQVATLPDFRRRGICSSLVYQAASYAFERMGVETLVMVADEDYYAARIYERLGFKPVERQVGVHDWWK
jgi:ribosomal protein S18 acetylase RimI-like enzyme